MSYALELKALRKNFGKTEIIRGVDLAVNAGERVAIIGPNGAGKSTLFNLISGVSSPPVVRFCSTASVSTEKTLRDQSHGLVTQFSNHQYFPQAQR